MGEVDDHGRESGVLRADVAGESEPGAERERTAEPRIHAKGGGLRATAGAADERGRNERGVAGVSERLAAGGTAGEGGDDPGVLEGATGGDRRSRAGGGRCVSGGASNAGGEQRGDLPALDAVGEAGIFLGGVGTGRRGVGSVSGDGGGVSTDCAGVFGGGAGVNGGSVVSAGVFLRV